MAGNSPLVAQHFLTVDGKNETHQQFTRIGMRRGFGQRDGMNVSNHWFIKHVLYGSALTFDARQNVRVGIGHDLKLAGSEELGRDVMPVAHRRLLRSQSLEEYSGFFLAPTPLKIHVPFRVLEIDADFCFPFWREQIFVSFRRFVRPD